MDEGRTVVAPTFAQVERNLLSDAILCSVSKMKPEKMLLFNLTYRVYQNEWSGFNLPSRLWKRMQKKVSHMQWNSRCSSFLLMRNLTPLFSLGLWRNTAIMATPDQEALCVLQFVRHKSVVSVKAVNPATIQQWSPHLPIALDAGISSFRQRGAFVKEKVRNHHNWHADQSVARTGLSSRCVPCDHIEHL